jgi:hypothetical protein
MNSTWKSGRHVKYGGDGYSMNTAAVSNINTNYMFTGNPANPSGWTENNPGGGQAANAPGDRRMLGSINYFSLQPNQRKTIEIAVGYGRTTDTSQVIGKNISEMKTLLNQVGNFWDTLSTPQPSFASNDTCNVSTSISEVKIVENTISIYPVPTSGGLTIKSDEILNTIEVYDMKGAQIQVVKPVNNKVNLNFENQLDGFYLLRIQSQDSSWETRKIILTK